MKVKELIEMLQECEPEADVWLQGCDCNNEAAGVEGNSKTVLILADV